MAEPSGSAPPTAETSSSTSAAVAIGEEKVKSAKQLEKEKKAAEKLAKFNAKKAKGPIAVPKTDKVKEKITVADKYVEETPEGEKKILKPFEDEAYKAYHPSRVESAWYSWWEKEGFFEPKFKPDGSVLDAGYFVIPAPPPNVTGALHMGHALGNALQDTLARWERMRGKTVLWLPGFDHAGIATQSVVEKMVWRTEQKTRHQFTRKDFVDKIWVWKEEYHTRIKNQMKKLGSSFDWSREAFSMDDVRYKAVQENFIRLHEDGTIYRANRLVNWCVKLNTTLSNLEVENKELKGRTMISVPGYDRQVEFGVITSFWYAVEGTDEKITVATTRPETMLGDTGIAVHPDDKRYTHLVGRNAIHPFIPGRKMPIVADAEVLMDFGTGAVKITPAHDANDFNIGMRHKLEFINLMNDDGTYNENAGEWQGKKRFDIRWQIVKRLKDDGYFVEVKDNEMIIPICEKSKDVIEAIMKPQWWVKQGDMAKVALESFKKGDFKIKPEVSANDFVKWMEVAQDWCISRQLWWGHQCPVYFVKLEGREDKEAHDKTENEYWVTGRSEEEAKTKAEAKFPGKTFTLEQDPDVLDTWFSSGLWPFSTLGWPDETLDMARFFPTSVLETGWDILFFWVARMVMLSLKLTGQVPFTEVFCHSLVRDTDGRKMSKSLGNVIDPLDVIYGIPLEGLHEKLKTGNLDPKEMQRAKDYQSKAFRQGIPECGSDALHFALCNYTVGNRDINMDINIIYGYRRFCNKIYQATKFALLRLGDNYIPPATTAKSGKETLVEKWMLHKSTATAEIVNKSLEAREFMPATREIYQHWFGDLCDVYIEMSKPLIMEGTPEQVKSARDTLYKTLENALLMTHPFMPFLTEELWQRLPRRPDCTIPSITIAPFPQFDESLTDTVAENSFAQVLEVAKTIRSVMVNNKVAEGAEIVVESVDPELLAILDTQKTDFDVLSKGISKLTLKSKGKRIEGATEPIKVEGVKETYVTLIVTSGDAPGEKKENDKDVIAGAVEAVQKKLGELTSS